MGLRKYKSMKLDPTPSGLATVHPDFKNGCTIWYQVGQIYKTSEYEVNEQTLLTITD